MSILILSTQLYYCYDHFCFVSTGIGWHPHRLKNVHQIQSVTFVICYFYPFIFLFCFSTFFLPVIAFQRTHRSILSTPVHSCVQLVLVLAFRSQTPIHILGEYECLLIIDRVQSSTTYAYFVFLCFFILFCSLFSHTVKFVLNLVWRNVEVYLSSCPSF